MVLPKAIFNYLTIFVFGLLSVPSLAILISWNTLPGERLYPVKRNLEKLALKIVGNNYKAQTALRSQFVNRRFSEASVLLTKSASTRGLVELTTDVKATKEVILTAKKPEERQQAAKKLAVQLQTYNQKLERQKEIIIYNQTIIYNVSQPQNPPSQSVSSPSQPQVTAGTPPPSAAGASPVTAPSSPPPQPSAPTPTPETVDAITDTQEELQQVIDELQSATAAPPSTPPGQQDRTSPPGGGQGADRDRQPPGQDDHPSRPNTGNNED